MDIAARSRVLQDIGLKLLDSYHLAFAEAAEVDFLLTTDDRFVKIADRIKTAVKVINPLNFLKEITP